MAKYKSFSKEVEKAFDTAKIKSLKLIGAMVQSEASQIARNKGVFDTGTLVQSMTHEIYETDKKYVRVGNPLKYAAYQEMGTGEYAKNGDGRKGGWFYEDDKGGHFTLGQKPRPFLEPAVNENKADIEEITQDVFREVMK